MRLVHQRAQSSWGLCSTNRKWAVSLPCPGTGCHKAGSNDWHCTQSCYMNGIMSGEAIDSTNTQSLCSNRGYENLIHWRSLQSVDSVHEAKNQISQQSSQCYTTDPDCPVSCAFTLNMERPCTTLISGVEGIWKGHQDLLKMWREGKWTREHVGWAMTWNYWAKHLMRKEKTPYSIYMYSGF